MKSTEIPERVPPASPVQVLTGLLWRYPWRFAAACSFGSCSAVLTLVPYVVVWWLVVSLIEGSLGREQSVWAAAVLGVGITLRHLCFAAASNLLHFAAFDLQVSIRREMFDRLFRVPLGMFDKNRESKWRTALLDDVEHLEDGLAHLIPETTAIFFGFAAAVTVMLWADWRLALAAIFPIAVALMAMWWLHKHGQPAADAYRHSWQELNGYSAELARGSSTLKLFNESGQVTAKFDRICDDFISAVRDWVRRCLLPGNIFAVLIGASLVFVLPLGLFLLGNRMVTTADMLLVTIVCFGLGENFVRLGDFMSRLSRQEVVLRRIAEVVQAPQISESTASVEITDTTLTFDHVSFSYDGGQALKDVSFTVPQGKVVALVGASGSGKSTVARLAARFFDPKQGRVSIGGADLRDIPPSELSKLVSKVFQDPTLFADTVAANIRVGREDADDAAVERVARFAQAHDFICALPLGYQTILHEKGANLSLGQRQRIAIARALLRDAPILLLDEVTSHADPETETLVQQALSALVQGRSVVIAAHRLRTIAGADEILVIDDGKIVERGSHRGLLALRGLYARFWEFQTARTDIETPEGAVERAPRTSMAI